MKHTQYTFKTTRNGVHCIANIMDGTEIVQSIKTNIYVQHNNSSAITSSYKVVKGGETIFVGTYNECLQQAINFYALIDND